jgi:uncharacterized protein involved in exopolysaccharide biosynthesis
VIGWFNAAPIYRSEGLLLVEPLARGGGGRVPPMLSAYIDSQVVFISSDRVLRRALESTRLQGLGLQANAEALALMRERLEVTRPRGSLNITVAFLHEDPQIAAAASRAIIESFQDLSRTNSFQQDTERLRAAQKMVPEFQDRPEWDEHERELARERLARVERLIEELNFQLRDKGRISVLSWGEALRAADPRHRIRSAIYGGAIGLGSALLLSLCIAVLLQLRPRTDP